MDIKIFVSYFRPFIKIPCECFIPIQSGKALGIYNLDMIGDDTGDNISKYNQAFSELTTQYWAWKQDIQCDYIGFFCL